MTVKTDPAQPAPADQAARDDALRVDRSFIVQAPAGSGKTELLTQRFLKLLGRVERPERVLAITFTRKATQEMRNRIMQRLQQARDQQVVESHEQRSVALASAVLAQDDRLQWGLLDNPGRLRIFTIDALCMQLLARDPEYGAVVNRLQVLEDATPLYRQAVRRMLEDLDAASAEDLTEENSLHERLVRVLVHLDGDTLRMEALLVRMLAIRDQWTLSLGQPLASLGRVLHSRQEAELTAFTAALGLRSLLGAKALLSSIGARLDDAEHPAARLAAAASDEPGETAPSLWQAYWLAQVLTTGGNKARGPGGITGKLFPELGADAAAWVAELKTLYAGWHDDPAAREAIERMAKFAPLDEAVLNDGLLEDVLELLRFVLAELNLVILSEGRTDFQFLAERALYSLQGNRPDGEAYGEVLLAEDRRLDHLLLDEFQDTSHTQHRLIKQLIGGWAAGDGRTLFLVGDPMQSIYRFRAADVGLFTRVVQQGRMGDVPLQVLTLTANFRSRREIVDWINQYFPLIFPAQDERDSGAVRYRPAGAERKPGGAVRVHAQSPDRTDEDEARQITALIHDCLQREDIAQVAVLVRARKHLQALARELVRAGIEFDAVKVDALASRPVIQDLLAITRALLHPADRVAAAALLRAPWCGLRLPELHRVIGEHADENIWLRIDQARQDPELAGETGQRLGRLSRIIATAQALRASLRLRELVEFTWLELGGPFAYADASELDNAAGFFALLDRIEQEGQCEVVERLGEALEALYARGKPAKVQLMTIHQAKGLEFDVVILPGLQRIGGRGEQALIAAQQFALDGAAGEGGRPEDSGLLMAPVTERGRDGPSVYRYLGAVDAERQRYESIRLLYVATTRARRELHLFGRFKFSRQNGWYADSGSFLQMLLPAFQSVLATLEHQTEDSPVAEPEPVPLPLLQLAHAPELKLEPLDLTNDQAADPPALSNQDAVALGEALHLWLELIHDHWEQGWSSAWFEDHEDMLESVLLRFGAAAGSVAQLLPRLRDMLRTALATEAGLGAISPVGASESHAELCLLQRDGNHVSRRIIDRLYRDQDGFWTIVDYKTGSSDAGTQQRWNDQLSHYATLVEAVTGKESPLCRVYQAEEGRSIPVTPARKEGSVGRGEGVQT